MLVLCLMLSVTYYAQNDAGIIGWSLALKGHICNILNLQSLLTDGARYKIILPLICWLHVIIVYLSSYTAVL